MLASKQMQADASPDTWIGVANIGWALGAAETTFPVLSGGVRSPGFLDVLSPVPYIDSLPGKGSDLPWGVMTLPVATQNRNGIASAGLILSEVPVGNLQPRGALS